MGQPLSNGTIRVFDTQVIVPGKRVHFDVMTTDQATAIRLAKEYLAELGYPNTAVTARECQFCHPEPLALFTAQQQKEFFEKGGFIVPI
jgi:hypothetical protein